MGYLNLVKQASMVKIASQWWKDQNLHEAEKNEAKQQAEADLENYRDLMERYEPPSQEELKRRLKERPKRFRTNWNFYVRDQFAEAYKKSMPLEKSPNTWPSSGGNYPRLPKTIMMSC